MENYYKTLGISPNATNEEILKAYKNKAKEFHPDKNNNSSASDFAFKIIAIAKDTLLDPEARLQHDYMFKIKTPPAPEPKIITIEKEKIVKVPVNEKDSVSTGGVLVGGLFLGLLLSSLFSDND